MKKTLIYFAVVGLMMATMLIVGCSQNSTDSLNPTSSYVQIPPEEIADNIPPFVKFNCSSNSVYPGTKVVVSIKLIDVEDDPLTMTYTCSNGQFVEISEGLYEWSMPDELGIYPLCVTVSDPYQSSTHILEVEVCEQPTFRSFE